MNDEKMKQAEDVVVESPEGTDKVNRNWAMGCHLVGFAQYLLPFPGAGVIAVLVLWSLKREDAAVIDSSGKEALNFQISLLIYGAVCSLLMFVWIGFLLIVPLALFGFICMIMAAIKASEGKEFKYPLCLRFVR